MSAGVTSGAASSAGMCDPSTAGSRLRRAVVAQFRRPSGWAGRLAGWIMARRASNVRRSLMTLELLGIAQSDRVLEIGCGPGVAIAAVARMAVDGHVVGVDHSETMVVMARRRNSAAITAGRVSIEWGRAEEFPVGEHSFDKVFAVNVFQFWADPSAVLRRVRRCLAPGGRIAITHQPRQRRATQSDVDAAAGRIVESLAEAGFANVTTSFLQLPPVAAVCVVAESEDVSS